MDDRSAWRTRQQVEVEVGALQRLPYPHVRTHRPFWHVIEHGPQGDAAVQTPASGEHGLSSK